jgi:hypothetical protein
MSHGNPYSKDSFPRHEVLRRMMLAINHGTSPSLAVRQPDPLHPGADAGLEELKKRKPWITHKKPEPWGAMLLSDNTRVMYGRDPGLVEDRYLAHVFGTFRAVLEEHLPVTTICDWNLTPEDLAPYEVLLLPNAACLSDGQANAVREWVRSGGGLVASLDTSLCNEFGDARPDLALADVLGVEPAGRVETKASSNEELDANFARNLDANYWTSRKNVFALRVDMNGPLAGGRLTELMNGEPVTLKGPVMDVIPDAGAGLSVAATFVPFANPDPAAPPAPKPAILTRTFGKGRVVYFAAGIDHGLYMYAYPYQRILLTNAIRWAAAAPPPVEIQAPMCVQTTVLRQQKDGQTHLLVHLFNDVNTTAFHGLPNEDVPLREETLPIHDIEIALRGYKVKSATQQPESDSLKVSHEGELDRVTVPRIDVHSIIVFEIEP